MNAATLRLARPAVVLGLTVIALALTSSPARAGDDDYDRDRKVVSCSSDDGRRNECPADLRGYVVRDVDQESRTECRVGRNWGYDDRGVWVNDGCRGTFVFDRGRDRDDDDTRTYGYREPGDSGADEIRVKCESRDGRRNECDADLRGYRIADVKEMSQADCDLGRNFGYDDRGIWVDRGCRGEFVFEQGRRRLSDSRDWDERNR